MITAANKNNGLARICAPRRTNAPPSVLTVPVMPLIAPEMSALLIEPKFFANTCAFSDAPSKSKLAKSPCIALNELLTFSNFDPAVNTATCSLASFNASATSPARWASLVICSGSVAAAISAFNCLSSAFIEPMPVSFKGICTSFITILTF